MPPEEPLVSLEWLLLPPLVLLAWTHLVAGVGFAIQAADRGEPIGLDRRTASLLVREGVGRAALWTLGLLVWFRPPGRPSPIADRRPPTLLVPGLTLNQASLWGLSTFLTRRGWRDVHALDRASPEGTLATEAEALGRRIRATDTPAGPTRVDLVGFGTGGLVIAWYLKHHGAERVRRVVTIGTPWRGTRLSVFLRSAAGVELRYGGPALDGLLPLPVPTVCIYSPDDPVVVPATSAVPDHGADVVRVEGAGHVDLLLSARVFRAVQAALDRPLANGILDHPPFGTEVAAPPAVETPAPTTSETGG